MTVDSTTACPKAERWIARWGDPGEEYNTNHAVATGCCCSMTALEPDERCSQHGAGEWPPRCHWCGKFMTYREEMP